MTDLGALSLLPTAVVIALALWTHRTIESLLAGIVVGLFLVSPGEPLALMAEISLAVMMNETVGWVILVCGFMGSLIAESFFGIPGLGSYTIDAINAQDFSIVRAMVFLGAALYIVGLILADISYTLADPRVRFE